jgi:hypothetical protein
MSRSDRDLQETGEVTKSAGNGELTPFCAERR